jgi:metallo-beta-lactamase class B
MIRLVGSALILTTWMLIGSPLHAQTNPDWTTPVAPFRIAGNLYYVGSKDLASYLIVTPTGDILINSNLDSSVPLIRKSVEQLGFKFADIKILLISHAHFDHDAGSAELLRQTGAQYMVMDGDVSVVESGGATDFAYGKDTYAPAKVNRVLHGGYFGMLAKLDRIKAGETYKVWIDPQGYQAAVAERERAFETELKRQEK